MRQKFASQIGLNSMRIMSLDKRSLLLQLRSTYEQRLAVAHRAEMDAREAAKTLATESEKKEDARAAIEFGSLAKGQSQRQAAAQAELDQLDALCARKLPVFSNKSPISLMALIDVLLTPEEGEEEGRTFLLLPFGAGTELTGPSGDGFLSVITPSSPVGKALLGKRVGDSAEVQLKAGVCDLMVLEVS